MDFLNFKNSETNEAQILEDAEFKYLYAVILKFCYSRNIDMLNGLSISLSLNDIDALHHCIKSELSDLLKFYVLPDEKIRGKHFGRYESFTFNNRKFIVDYTFSKIGRLMYTLSVRIDFIQRVINSKGHLVMSIVPRKPGIS